MGVDYKATLVYGLQVEPPSPESDWDERDEQGCELLCDSAYDTANNVSWFLATQRYTSGSARYTDNARRVPPVGVGDDAQLEASLRSRKLTATSEPGWFLFVRVT